MSGRALTRRALLERAGLLGAAATLAQIPGLLDAKGWAQESSDDLVDETLSALVAFILPGDDPHSAAQGTPTKEPGGIAAGTVPVFKANLDAFVPAAVPGLGTTTVPASGGVATLLNRYAMQVNPGASAGGFAAPFARLSWEEKVKVFELFESDTAFDDTEFKFVGGILPGFVGFLAWSEGGVFDRETGKLASKPVGWQLSKFAGPAEGHAELKGYYQGRRKARA